MLTTRAQVIGVNRAVVITSVEQQALEPGQRIYLLDCTGDKLKLIKTGLFSYAGHRSVERAVAGRKKDDRVVLVFVCWDGDNGNLSRHPVDRIGLTLTDNTQLVVTSLAGITWHEGRPARARSLHTPS